MAAMTIEIARPAAVVSVFENRPILNRRGLGIHAAVRVLSGGPRARRAAFRGHAQGYLTKGRV